MSDSGSGDDADVALSSRPQRNVFDMLGDSDAEHSDEAPQHDVAPTPAATRRAPPPARKQAAAKPASDDIDALLADLNADEPAAGKPGKNKKKQKGKKQAAAEPAPAARVADVAPKKVRPRCCCASADVVLTLPPVQAAGDDIEAILAGLEVSDAPSKSKKKQKGKKDAGAPVTAAGRSPVADAPQQVGRVPCLSLLFHNSR